MSNLFKSKKQKQEEYHEVWKTVRDSYIDTFNKNAEEGKSGVTAIAADGEELILGWSVDIIIVDTNKEPVAKFHVAGWSADDKGNPKSPVLELWVDKGVNANDLQNQMK